MQLMVARFNNYQELVDRAPLLGGGEPGPSCRAFPFSVTENLFVGAMGVVARSETMSKEEEASGTEEEMGNGGSAPSPFIAGEGQPAPPMITGDGFTLHAAGTRRVRQLPRQRGEAEMPTSNQPPRVE